MRLRGLIAIVALAVMIAPLTAVRADAPPIKTSVTITGTGTDVSIRGLTNQSSCTIEIDGTASGTVEGIVQGVTVNVNAVQIPDGGNPSPSITGPGQFTANCAGMSSFIFHPTSVTGSAIITIDASSAVGRIIGAGVNGGRTYVVGAAPVTVSNSGSTATVALSPLPLPLADGGTGAMALPSGCLQSNGTVVSSTGGPCAAQATPVSVQAGTGVTVATPSPGVFVVSATSSGGVTSVSGTGNISSTGGTTPVISITPAPTFSWVLSTNSSIGDFYASGPDTNNLDQGFSATYSGAAEDTPNAFVWANTYGSARTTLGSSSSTTINSVTGQCGLLTLSHGSNPLAVITPLQAWDCSGNAAVANKFGASYFIANSAGVPWLAGSSGATTTHIEVGHENITAAAGVCTDGASIGFSTSFASTPVIVLTTQSNIALHAEISTTTPPSTSAFVPSLCNTSGSPITATVYYNATGP